MSAPATPLNLKKTDVCERLNISPRTLEGLVNEGMFPPAVRIGKYVYWREECVAEFMSRMFAAQKNWRPV